MRLAAAPGDLSGTFGLLRVLGCALVCLARAGGRLEVDWCRGDEGCQ